MADVSLFSYLI
jgi:hypothetical protein